MKQCKDCRNRTTCNIDLLDDDGSLVEENVVSQNCWFYARKWWKVWAPKLLITLALLIAGCVCVKLPDGTTYLRVGPQEIGEVLISKPDGTNFRMERQKAVMPVLIVTPTGFQWGEAREVKP